MIMEQINLVVGILTKVSAIPECSELNGLMFVVSNALSVLPLRPG